MRNARHGRSPFAGLVAAGLLGACAGGAVSPAAGPVPLHPDSFERRIMPFTVVDESGVPFEQPFLGGFNIPRPQLLDIDGDGDDDLFVQEASNSVMYFERTEGGRQPTFAWRTDRFHDLDVGEWYRFVDLDRDGDADLLAEEPFSYVRYYRNDGTPAAPRFVLAADSLKDTQGRPLFSDRQNIPNATDIDCDGRVDLLVGRLEGTVTRYEEVGVDANDVPRFEHVTDRFEDIEIVAQIGSNRHGANTMALGDVDADGDEDLFWGDYFEAGVLLIENTGTCRTPDFRGTPRSFPEDEPLVSSGYNAPTVGDVDGDGDPDLLVGVLGGAFNPNTTTADNFHYIEQNGDADGFEVRSSRFLSTIDVGSESIPVLVDLDGDGDEDLLLGNKIEQNDPQNGRVYRFLREGTATEPVYRLAGTLDVGPGYHHLPAFGDLDGDGDLDAVLGTWEDALRLYRNVANDGGIELVLADSAVAVLSRGRNATPTLGDLDADGDLDLIVGESSGTLNHYENVGSPTSPVFELVTDELGGFDVGRRSLPVLRDADGDGDLDLIVGTEAAGLHFFRNDGTTSLPDFVDAGRMSVEDFGFAAPAFGDLDGDGDVDLLLGGSRGGLWMFEATARD